MGVNTNYVTGNGLQHEHNKIQVVTFYGNINQGEYIFFRSGVFNNGCTLILQFIKFLLNLLLAKLQGIFIVLIPESPRDKYWIICKIWTRNTFNLIRILIFIIKKRLHT